MSENAGENRFSVPTGLDGSRQVPTGAILETAAWELSGEEAVGIHSSHEVEPQITADRNQLNRSGKIAQFYSVLVWWEITI